MNREELFAQLKILGIKQLWVEYAGGGDSGQIDYISAFRGEGRKYNDAEDVDELFRGDLMHDEFQAVQAVTAELRNKPDEKLSRQIEQFAYDLLENLSDWCNNDGGGGKLIVFVEDGVDDKGEPHEAGEIHAHHYTNWTQVNYEEVSL